MASRAFAFVIWAAVAASAVFWALRLGSSALAAPPHTVTVDAHAQAAADLGRLLGRTAADAPDAPAAEPSTALKLVGVVAPRQGSVQAGVALISIDGQPARPYRVGAMVDDPLVLLKVQQRVAALGPRDGPPTLTLELPLPAPPSTGTLAPAAAGAPGVTVPPQTRAGNAPRPRLPPPVPAAEQQPIEPPVPVEEEPPQPQQPPQSPQSPQS